MVLKGDQVCFPFGSLYYQILAVVPRKGDRSSMISINRTIALILLPAFIGCAALVGCNRAASTNKAISVENRAEAKRVYEEHRQRLTGSIAWSNSEELKWQERLSSATDSPEYADVVRQYNQFRKDATDTQEKLAEIVNEAKELSGE